MPQISSGQAASLVLEPGESYTISATGVATVKGIYGAPATTTTLNSNFAVFGPYGVPAKLDIACTSGSASYALDQYEGDVVRTKTNHLTGEIALSVQGPYDVVVYGATPGGIMAAVAAIKEGMSAAIFEPSTRIGGMMTGGLNYTDVNKQQFAGAVVGLSNEFLAEVAQEYGLNKQQFHRQSANAEPSMFQRVFQRWIQRYRIPVFTGYTLKSVNKTGTRVTSIVFDQGVVSCKGWIDSTYEGDLIAAAGCSFFIGRESNATYGETNNGVRPIGTLAQFVDGVDPYVVAGQPASGLLPGVYNEPLGTVGAASPYVQAFNYRVTTSYAGNRVPVPEPTNYNPLEYELVARQSVALGGVWTVAGDLWQTDILQPTGVKGDWNNKGAISSNYVRPECTEYITATPARRAEIREIIKQWWFGLYKFARTDTRLPAAFRAHVALFGLAADEHENNGNFSPALYVREGRRLVGDFVLKEQEVAFANAFTDEVAFIYYAIDSHHVRRIVTGGMVKNEGFLQVAPVMGTKIPLRVVMPKVAEATNGAATFAISASHVAFCSARMEPIHMALGQAAGTALAIAIRKGINIQAVSASDVQNSMDIYGTKKLGRGAILSTDGTTFTAGTITTNGAGWANGTGQWGFVGANYAASSATGDYKRFAPNLVASGQYRVFARWPDMEGAARSANVPFTIVHAGGTTTLSIAQGADGQGGDWCDLGVYNFNKGTPSAHYVQVGTDGAGGSTVINAVKWVAVPNP